MSSKNKLKKESVNYLMAAVLIFTVGIIPAVCRLYKLKINGVEKALRDNSVFWDIFSYQKSVLICVSAAVLLCAFLLEALTESGYNFKRFKRPQFIMIGVYMLFTVISTLFSSYMPVSLNGITERYEGLYVLISYVLFFIIAQAFAVNERCLKFIVAGFFLSALIVGGIGLFQFFGLDIFSTEFAKTLFVGKDLRERVQSLNVKIDGVYSTLYNPNCAGSYSAMLASFFIALGAFLPVKNYLKYVSIFFAGVMTVNLFGSGSAGGIIGFGAAMFVFAAVFVVDMFANKRVSEKPVLYKTAFGLGILAVVLGAASVLFVPQLKAKLSAGVEGMINAEGNTIYKYKSMRVDGPSAYIETAGGELMIKYDKLTNDVSFYGIDGQPVKEVRADKPDNSDENSGNTDASYSYDYEGVQISKTEFWNYTIQYTENDIKDDTGTFASVVLTDWNITDDERVTDKTFMFCVNSEGNLIPLTKKKQIMTEEDIAPSMVFDNIYFGTGRGYIWSRSIPVALRHFFIGSGPDTFAFEFPQNDLYAKLQSQGNPYIIVDKPHNLYLQSAVNTGCISLIALLALFIYYIYRTFKTIVTKKPTGFIFAVQAAALAGVCGYLASGLATDSVVSVAPVFWVLIGTGYAVDEM